MAKNLPVSSLHLHQEGWSICPNLSNSSSIRLSKWHLHWTYTTTLTHSSHLPRRAINTFMLSMDDIQGPIRGTSILKQLGKEHECSWYTLRWFHQEGVSTNHSHGEHPKRDHGWEIERCNSSTHAQRQTVGISVHVFSDGGHGLSQYEGCHTASMFNHLCSRKGNMPLDDLLIISTQTPFLPLPWHKSFFQPLSPQIKTHCASENPFAKQANYEWILSSALYVIVIEAQTQQPQ